jgi:hypothetical protein
MVTSLPKEKTALMCEVELGMKAEKFSGRIAVPYSISALERVGCSTHHRRCALWKDTRYALYRRLGRPQEWSGQVSRRLKFLSLLVSLGAGVWSLVPPCCVLMDPLVT